MKLEVKVTWANAGHALLPEALAEVTLTAGSSPLSAKASKTGERHFEIPDGTTNVTLNAQFSVAFGPVGKEPAKKEVVWRATQPFTVKDGTELVPTDIPAYVKGHPLVETHAASGTKGAVLLRLRTEFVNITPFWLAYAEKSAEYTSDHDPKASLVALGYTGGKPLIWFASFTDTCLTPPKPAMSCLVFFRPATRYAYNRVDQVHSMYGLNRFLLKPVDDPAADYWKRDVMTMPVPAPEGAGIYVRCGFEDALVRSGKAVVMLHPWPSINDFGAAQSSMLPRLCEAAIRFLWAEQRVAQNRGAIQLGRLGVSGFSAGGLPLFEAVGSNADRVDEVYSFDGVGANAAAPRLIQWFNKSPTTRCLRMSNGHQMASHLAIKAAIKASTRVSADPESPHGYDMGVNPMWDHAVSELEKGKPEVRKYPGLWHQFSAFGGYISSSGPFAVTYLLRFLQGSDF